MVSHKHFNEGTELGLLLITIYNETHTKVSQESIGTEHIYRWKHSIDTQIEAPIAKIFSFYDDSASSNLAKETFMKAAIK